ncbi:MAG: sugar phosphate isomerase/epimerase [Bryobacteraceae bacterium]|jgi:sugar phosphate isomerase/epimerase
MKLQNFKTRDRAIIKAFLEFRKQNIVSQLKRLNLSWSNWGFGMEPLETSAKRLENNKIRYIELHGNLYGKDLGYRSPEVNQILRSHGIKVGGICGMVWPESEFSSSSPLVRQHCIDYFRRHIDFCSEVGGQYILFTPGAVGRPNKYDDNEFCRAAETIRIIGDDFLKAKIRCGIEPVRKDEVSLCHTFAEAKALIDEIDHPGVKHIAGDVFHMLLGEEHIGETILKYGELLTNLHLADSNRRALGTGMLDIDIVIMALYLVGFNNEQCFCSPEPLGAGSNPYDQMNGRPDPRMLDEMVRQTASYFYEREEEVLNAGEMDLLES